MLQKQQGFKSFKASHFATEKFLFDVFAHVVLDKADREAPARRAWIAAPVDTEPVEGMRSIIPAARALAAQCAIQISENIFDLFHTYRQTQQGGRNPGHLALLLALMGMNHRSGMGNERLHTAQAHGQQTDFRVPDHFIGALVASLDFKGEHAAKATRHLLLCQPMLWIRWQARIIDALDLWMLLQKLG